MRAVNPMNPIERLREMIAKAGATECASPCPILTRIIRPADPTKGSWHLDIEREGNPYPILVEWRPDRGFGVSTLHDPDDYGTGPDEVYGSARGTFNRVAELLRTGEKTKPPEVVGLAELRQWLGLTQCELAEKAGVKQANISRIEGRADIRLSTLSHVIRAMGGELKIKACFPDGTERELSF